MNNLRVNVRGVSNVHLVVGDGVRAQDVLEEALGPHARFGLASKTRHGLNALN
jgi:hypothetical protein